MRMIISDSIKISLPKTESIKDFMGLVGEHSLRANTSLDKH